MGFMTEGSETARLKGRVVCQWTASTENDSVRRRRPLSNLNSASRSHQAQAQLPCQHTRKSVPHLVVHSTYWPAHAVPRRLRHVGRLAGAASREPEGAQRIGSCASGTGNSLAWSAESIAGERRATAARARTSIFMTYSRFKLERECSNPMLTKLLENQKARRRQMGPAHQSLVTPESVAALTPAAPTPPPPHPAPTPTPRPSARSGFRRRPRRRSSGRPGGRRR